MFDIVVKKFPGDSISYTVYSVEIHSKRNSKRKRRASMEHKRVMPRSEVMAFLAGVWETLETLHITSGTLPEVPA
ncbi:MAG: hypothetical protein HY369_01515 [Candidatus Aenigmarchaeota archaeon]|nr:hypothetical protein [Candidatus Aenigmarchaeota archaeon]